MPEEMIDHRADLAGRFCAAVISQRLGIGMDYALQKYVRQAGKSECWLELADRVQRDVAKQTEK